jgi:polar amino acid transport system substrate-binding protein
MRLPFVGLALAATLVIAACGSSAATPPSSLAYQGPWPAKVDKIASEVPDSIRKLAPLQFATSSDSLPIDGIDPKTGALAGWDVDIGAAICSVWGIVCTPNNVTFDDILAQLKASTPDEIANGDAPRYILSIAGWTPTQARENSGIDFISYADGGENWVEKVGGPTINQALDMCGHTVATGSGGIEEAQAWGFMGKLVGGVPIKGDPDNCTQAGKQDITVLSVSGVPAVYAALLSGRADFVWDDGSIPYKIAQINGTGPAKIKVGGQPCSNGAYAIALVKGSPIEQAVTDAVKYIIDNGYYGKILTHWNAADSAIPSSQVTLNNNAVIGTPCVPNY